jgi:hypothetical protein
MGIFDWPICNNKKSKALESNKISILLSSPLDCLYELQEYKTWGGLGKAYMGDKLKDHIT